MTKYGQPSTACTPRKELPVYDKCHWGRLESFDKETLAAASRARVNLHLSVKAVYNVLNQLWEKKATWLVKKTMLDQRANLWRNEGAGRVQKSCLEAGVAGDIDQSTGTCPSGHVHMPTYFFDYTLNQYSSVYRPNQRGYIRSAHFMVEF